MNVPEFLLFDLGRVLLNFDHEIGIRQLAEVTECDPSQIRQIVFDSTLQKDYETGRISTSAFCDRIRQQTGSSASDDRLCRAASDIFWLNQSVVPLVTALRQVGWKIGILSNTCEAHWTFIREAGYKLIDLFDPWVLSFEVGAMKPQPEIYAVAVERVGVEPSRIFFVDDLPANVQGAREAGLDAVVYTSTEKLVAELRGRGVRFNL